MKPSSFYHKWSITLLLAILSIHSSASDSHQPRSSRSVSASSLVTKIPRGGGGWFGRNNNHNKKNKNGSSTEKKGKKKKFPALSQSEIEEKLNIPVFGITDLHGHGITLKNAKDTNQQDSLYLFFSEKMANQAMKAILANNENVPELKLTPLHLGKMWFRLLHNESRVFDMKPHTQAQIGDDSPDANDESIPNDLPAERRPVSFRLVPDSQNLIGARLLSSLKPEDSRELVEAMKQDNRELVKEMVERWSSESTFCSAPYNEIPLFCMPHLRSQRKDTDDSDEKSKFLLPMFFGAKNMVQAYLETVRDRDIFDPTFDMNNYHGSPQVKLVQLDKLVEQMQSDSDFDFRSIVLFPLAEEEENENDEDDDNDGGGGDFGISAKAAKAEEPQIELYTEFTEVDTSAYYQQEPQPVY